MNRYHLLPPEDVEPTKEHWLRCVQTGEDFEREHRFRARDVIYRNVLAIGRPIKDDTGKIVKWVGLNLDITERKRAEDQIQASLREKDVLLREIHHRVKNNLQIVSSLIDLQSSHIDDKETLALFAESRSRIRSMALIHEQLYRSTDMDRIDFETYIELLVDGLARSVAVSPRVSIRTDVRPFRLDIDRAVACGLIVNELVTNAIKHAFPPDATGDIQVRFGCEHGDVCELVVSDNGTGIEPGKEMSDSLGMELVESLVGQLGGKMAVSSNGGSSFSITFPAGAEERS